jgi:hypothetical protein
MEQHPASRPNVVSLFFGMAMAAVLIAVLIASLFFNKLPQPQPTDPAILTQSQQPGYTYTEAAATETVHNKALLLLVAVGSMAAALITGMMIVSSITNRRIMRQMVQLDQQHTAAWQVQEVYITDNRRVIQANRASRKAYRS